MTLSGMCEFIARQLNDHEDCDHGVRQGTYHTWTEAHIKQALSLAASYLFSIKADDFASPVVYYTPTSSCVIDTSVACDKPLEILSIGDSCDNVTEETEEVNAFLSMMNTPCVSGGNSDSESTNYTVVKKSGSVYSAKAEIPANTKITLLCATAPSDIDAVPNNLLSEYQPLLVNFALWWLLLTDNESRSNQPRWEAYYQMIQWFVETKLLLEFSLSEDDYKYGRRRVND